MFELPDSISLLCNLTKLDFSYCTQLKALLLRFGALTQLRSLDCRGITELVRFRFKRVIKPRGIEKLTRLEVLYPFVVSKEDDTCSYESSTSSIHELADLNSLRRLSIENLENVRGGKIEAEKAKLKEKQNIQYLELQWNFKEENEEQEVGVNNFDMVLEGLQPHPNLEELHIKGFPGLKSPKWIGSSSCLPNLVELSFYECKSCIKLVGLGPLPCLRILKIEKMNSIKCLGKELYYQQDDDDDEGSKGSATTTTPTRTLFPSLTRLHIGVMDNLEEWFAPDNSFTCLEEIYIYGCGNLTSIPDLRLWTSSLRKLTIMRCQKLEKERIKYYLDKFLPSDRYYWE